MISVIVPIYNAQKYLRECLDSIANQTYNDIEVIMVNDGSTDESGKICREYEEKYANFHLINKENGGQMSAWILGVKNSHGEYFGFVDSDDYIEPTMYEEMMRCEEKTNADVVMCGRYNLNTVSAVPSVPDYKEYYDEKTISEIYDIVFPTMSSSFSQARWDKLFKRDIYIENMNRYCQNTVRTFEDRFIVGPYIFSCKSFAFVPKPLYYWREIKGSSSSKPRPELCDIMESLYKTQLIMLKDKGFYESYKDKAEVGKIDIIRAIIERNLGGKVALKSKYKIAARLLSNENREIVLKHKKDCVGKFGKYIYYANKLNSKSFMILGAVFFRVFLKKDNDEAF